MSDDEKFEDTINEISEAYNADVFLFSSTIDEQTADSLILKIRKVKNKRDNCVLVLTTLGGDPDAGYRIIRHIKSSYIKLTLFVFGACKSTGTLMALGADDIVMSDFGEFGPLDIQLTKDDEMTNTSGLSYLQSLILLNEQLFKSFEENFLSLKRRSGYSITTKTAAEIGSKLAVGIISPISAQIDPLKLGEVQRAIKIAAEYGKRLCKDTKLIAKLMSGYPSHGFVIDYEEAKTMFPSVRKTSIFEEELEKLLFGLVRNENSNDTIYVLSKEKEVIDPDVEDSVEEGEMKQPGVEAQEEDKFQVDSSTSKPTNGKTNKHPEATIAN